MDKKFKIEPYVKSVTVKNESPSTGSQVIHKIKQKQAQNLPDDYLTIVKSFDFSSNSDMDENRSPASYHRSFTTSEAASNMEDSDDEGMYKMDVEGKTFMFERGRKNRKFQITHVYLIFPSNEHVDRADIW